MQRAIRNPTVSVLLAFALALCCIRPERLAVEVASPMGHVTMEMIGRQPDGGGRR